MLRLLLLLVVVDTIGKELMQVVSHILNLIRRDEQKRIRRTHDEEQRAQTEILMMIEGAPS